MDQNEDLTVDLFERKQAWAVFREQVFPFLAQLFADGKHCVLTIKLESRSAAQNRLMWPLLHQFSKQLLWPVNGAHALLSKDEWKDVLTAAFYGETVRLAQGLNGGLVMLGLHTRSFSKRRFSEFIEFLYAEAAHRNVNMPIAQERIQAAIENRYSLLSAANQGHAGDDAALVAPKNRQKQID